MASDIQGGGRDQGCGHGQDGRRAQDPGPLTYRASGVDLDAADQTIERLKGMIARTNRAGVMGAIGGFGGLFDIGATGYRHPVLVSGTDSVGTKLKVAFATGRHDTIGQDCVAMCVNDILTHGAEPLFFLDYLAVAAYDPAVVTAVVSGVVRGCELAGCALIGGETAQLPGMYQPGEYDLAGFAVGAVERDRVLDGTAVRPGDAIIGLGSSGLHSNGYSLARRALLERAGLALDDRPAELSSDASRTLADELLTPTTIYAKQVLAVLRAGLPVRGMANITGGGLRDNSFRILGEGMVARFDAGAWPVPPVYRLLARAGGVGAADMLRTFNCGLGYLVFLPAAAAGDAVAAFAAEGVPAYLAGRVEAGERGFTLVGGSAESLFG
jgi:phosphoribosylformylglycinamidine cyclo-ligase